MYEYNWLCKIFVCVYVYICEFMYESTCVIMCVFMYECIQICKWVCSFVWFVNVCMSFNLCIYDQCVYVCVGMCYVCTYVRMCIFR